jgi:hypothetical protein
MLLFFMGVLVHLWQKEKGLVTKSTTFKYQKKQ